LSVSLRVQTSPKAGQGWSGRGGEGQAGVPKGIIALLSPCRRNDHLSEIDGYHVPVKRRLTLYAGRSAPGAGRYMQALGAGLFRSALRVGSSRYVDMRSGPRGRPLRPRGDREAGRCDLAGIASSSGRCDLAGTVVMDSELAGQSPRPGMTGRERCPRRGMTGAESPESPRQKQIAITGRSAERSISAERSRALKSARTCRWASAPEQARSSRNRTSDTRRRPGRAPLRAERWSRHLSSWHRIACKQDRCRVFGPTRALTLRQRSSRGQRGCADLVASYRP
jgi:hypothetical protein